MLEGRLACKGCHTISGEGGRIGPPLEGISDRLPPSFVFDIISDPGRVVPGARMPGQHLRPRDARRVASYLIQMSGTGRTAEYSPLLAAGHPSLASTRAVTSEPGNESEDDLAAGVARYARHCASCRGSLGRGEWFQCSVPCSPGKSSENSSRTSGRSAPARDRRGLAVQARHDETVDRMRLARAGSLFK